jgi:hypothetical protein
MMGLAVVRLPHFPHLYILGYGGLRVSCCVARLSRATHGFAADSGALHS